MNFKFDGKQKSISLGAYPGISQLEARERRDEARRQLDEGIDLAVARKLRISANIEASRVTFEKVAREWHEANAPQWARVHAAEVIRTLERDVLPAIGSLPIGALNPPTILAVLRAIEARSAIETAKRIRQRIVRRQNIWRNSRRKLAESGPRLGFDIRRRAFGAASSDIGWSVV